MEMHLFKWAMTILISMIWAKMICSFTQFMYMITLGVFLFRKTFELIKAKILI